jgi:hypothetical protein
MKKYCRVTERNIVHTVKERKIDWMSHILCRNCLLKYATEGKWRIEVMGRQGRRHKQLLDDLKGTIVKIERRSTRSQSVENSLWKKLCTCHSTHFWEKEHMLHVSAYVHVEICVYTCLLCLTSSRWQPAFGRLSFNSSKSFRISPCPSPIILKVVCCIGRIAAFAAADFEMPVCWSRYGEHCRVAQRCTNFPEIWEQRQCSWCQKGDVKQVHY